MSMVDLPVARVNYENSMLATSTTTTLGGTWWFLDQLLSHGPSWNLIPPLIFGTAALISAICTATKIRQDLRHKEELHAIAVMAARHGLSAEMKRP
jgi:hypothetical protein